MRLALRNTIFSNWTIALFLLVPIIIWVTPFKQKYDIEVKKVEHASDEELEFYADLNNDGISQRIEFETNFINNNTLKLFIEGTRGQINMSNQPTIPKSYVIEDYDQNNINDFFCLGYRNDSVFINRFEYTPPYEPVEYFVLKLSSDADYEAFVNQVADLDYDGIKDVVFTIHAGFSLQPRKIYVYNIARDTLFQSPFVGAKPEMNSCFIDFDGENSPESIVETSMPMNYGERDVPYTDMYGWVMGVNDELEFLFNPIKITEKKATIKAFPFLLKNNKYILTTCIFQTENNNVVQYAVHDFNGKEIKKDSLVFDGFEKLFFEATFQSNRKIQKKDIRFIDHSGTLYKLSSKFKFVKDRKINDFECPRLIAEADLNGDGIEEMIFNHYHTNAISISTKDFKDICRLDFQSYQKYKENISLYKQENKPPLLVVQKGSELFHLAYSKNHLRMWRFPFYILTYAAILGFLLFLGYIQREKIKRRLFAKQQIKELQYRVISSQLNPHFTFNTLNTLAHIAYDPKRPELYDHFTNFARMVRALLADTDKNARSLQKEIQLTTDFLEIQKFRFSNAFSYSININNDVDQNILIPKLIIQLFAENAVKHAFPCHEGEDHLNIEVKNFKEKIKIEICDNGLGRKQAAKRLKSSHDQSNGIGIKVMKDYIDMLNEQNKYKISFSIFDRSESMLPAGTIVIVSIPKKFSYNDTPGHPVT